MTYEKLALEALDKMRLWQNAMIAEGVLSQTDCYEELCDWVASMEAISSKANGFFDNQTPHKEMNDGL